MGVSCLYADYKDQANQTLDHILGSLLRQLLTTAQEPIPDEVINKLDDNRRWGGKVGAEDILALLKIRLHQLKSAFICIDAVDELKPRVRQQLLDILKELITHNTHLFLTGRGHIEGEVKKRFAQGYAVILSASRHDIQRFVRHQINEDYDINPEAMDLVLAKDIEEAIIERSKGM